MMIVKPLTALAISLISLFTLSTSFISCSNSNSSASEQKSAPKDSISGGDKSSKLPEPRTPTTDIVKDAEAQFKAYIPTIEKNNQTSVAEWKSHSGDFSGDGQPDVVVFFYQTPPTGGNMHMGSGLVFYENQNGAAKVVAGFEPDYSFSVKNISDGKVHIEESIFEAGDSPCCPSSSQNRELTVAGGKVTDVKVGKPEKLRY